MTTSGDEKKTWERFEVPPDLTKNGIYVGTSGYYYDDWIGLFNPPKLSAKKRALATEDEKREQDRLQFYQNYFSFVEINHTFYQEPLLAHFLDIEKRSKPGMLYSVKVHKEISHTRDCNTVTGRELMRRYCVATSLLVETGRFYSFLVQLEDRFYRTQQRLDYLRAIGDVALAMRMDVHVEFRHASWHIKSVLQSLKDSGIGVCNTDIPPIPQGFPLKAYATTDKGYVRYSGRNLENWYPSIKPVGAAGRIVARNARYDYLYSDGELDELVQGQIKLIKKTGKVAIAFNNHYRAQAIRNAIDSLKRLQRLLNEG